MMVTRSRGPALVGLVLLSVVLLGTESAVAAGPAPAARPSVQQAVAQQLVAPTAGARRTCPAPNVLRDAMTLPQRVGELLMMGNPATGAAAVTGRYIKRYHVGSVLLTGRSKKGLTHTRAVVEHLQSFTTTASTGGTKLVVATDQEGGYVQVLQGPGFSRMPTALYQGTHWSLDSIRAHARTWGGQLARAGVNLDLAPVVDTVSKAFAPYNAPIGYLYREYGYTPHDVLMRGTAFANGLRDAGMGVTVKHFPGLGRVRRNTDTAAGVTDTVTGRHSASIRPFAEGIRTGADAVMVSTAHYEKIAPNIAAFSTTIMHTMLRDQLHFRGTIISDDLGNAKQVHKWKPGRRAGSFIAHHGNLVLTVDPATVPAMYRALLSRARHSSAFRRDVNQSALHVLEMKQRLGLLC